MGGQSKRLRLRSRGDTRREKGVGGAEKMEQYEWDRGDEPSSS